MQNIHSQVRSFIVDNFLFGQRSTELSDETSFLESGIIDSTGVLELIGFLEERYGITVEDEELVPANLDSVDRVASFVGRKLRAVEGDGAAVRLQA